MTIRRFGPLSMAKVFGLTYALLGLIFGAFFSLFSVLGAFVGSGMGEHGAEAFFGLLFGVGAVIVLPLFYGAMGFLSGLVGAFFYNLVAGMVGGIEMELEGR